LLFLLVALAQEARQLGRERVARRQILFLAEQIDAAFELLDVRGGVGVGRDRFAHLLAVLVGRRLEVLGVDVELHQLAEAVDERERGARARRE
jgi:hypothetical protein